MKKQFWQLRRLVAQWSCKHRYVERSSVMVDGLLYALHVCEKCEHGKVVVKSRNIPLP